jgi:hypothetical protein
MNNSQMAYMMAFLSMYPAGEEAMDIRFAQLDARMAAGLGVVQMKRGKTAKLRPIFDREFWTRPRSLSQLKDRIMTAFKALGMEGDEDG